MKPLLLTLPTCVLSVGKFIEFLRKWILQCLRDINPIALIPAIVLLLAFSLSDAAELPKDVEELEEQAVLVVIGKVLEVTTKVEKSKIETYPGVHKDTIYTITVEVHGVSKGASVKKGEKITILAWRPHTREPNPPGLQGHVVIPKKGDTATFYLSGGGKESYEPLHPNGIVIKQAE